MRIIYIALFLSLMLSCEPPNKIDGPSKDNPIISNSRRTTYILLNLKANADSSAFGYTAIAQTELKSLKTTYDSITIQQLIPAIIRKEQPCDACLYVNAYSEEAIAKDSVEIYQLESGSEINQIVKTTKGGGVDYEEIKIKYH